MLKVVFQMYMGKTKKSILGISLIIVMFVGVFFTTSFINTDPKEDLWNRIEVVRNRLIASATNGTGGSVTNGASEIVNILIYPWNADNTTYYDNLSESNAYEHFDASFSNGEELEGETPHSTAFAIILIMQYADEHVYDTAWNVSLCDAWCNESQLSISSQLMEKMPFFYDNDTGSDAKINFWLEDSNGGDGTGFTIVQLEQIDDIQFKPAYYS